MTQQQTSTNDYIRINKTIEKIISSVIIVLWLVVGVYIGTASLVTTKQIADYEESKKLEQLVKADTTAVIYEGIPFANKQAMLGYINDVKFENVSKWFDWSGSMPDFLVLILGACSFGMVGAVIKILYEHVFEIKTISENKYCSLPLLGFLSGFISIGISYLLPNIFLESAKPVSAVGLILFSMFFGYFIKEFFERIQNHLFKKKDK